VINSNKTVGRELVAVATHNSDLLYPSQINTGTPNKRRGVYLKLGPVDLAFI